MNNNQQINNQNAIDSHCLLIGRLVNNAAVCDVILFSVFKSLSGCTLEIARAIYYTNESLQAKKRLVDRTLKASNFKESEKIVNKIVKATSKAHTQRNELSHSLIRFNADNQALAQNPRHQQKSCKLITEAYLDSLLKNSTKAFLECQQAANELSQITGEQYPENL